LSVDTDALRELVRRLDGYRTSTDLGAAWKRGVPRGWLDALVADWRVFDSDALQMRLDALRQQRAEVAGIACTWCTLKVAVRARCRCW